MLSHLACICCAIACILMNCPAVLGQDEPFLCLEKGREMMYTRRYIDKNGREGEVKWTHQMKFHQVDTTADGGKKVVYTSQLFKPSGKAITKEPVRVVAEITPKGDVEIDLSVTMISVLRGFIGNGWNITAEGEKTYLPASLSAGDLLPDAATVISAMGMRLRITVSQRYVVGFEELQTSVGRFHCVIISEHKVEKGMGRNRITTARTWYCRGIGMIRHDTYDKSEKLETSEVLSGIK